MEAKEELIKYIKENQSTFYKLAYTYTKNKDLALDTVQESIIKALENIEKLKHKEYIKTWFYRILINESLKMIKKYKRNIEYGNFDRIDFNKGSEDNIAENLDIYNSIKKLDNKLKTVIVLRFFEGMKIDEIALITKSNVNTVKSRLYKAINEIKSNC